MPFNLFPILWRLLLLKINELFNFHYFFRNFTCNSPNLINHIIFPDNPPRSRQFERDQ